LEPWRRTRTHVTIQLRLKNRTALTGDFPVLKKTMNTVTLKLVAQLATALAVTSLLTR
jgi:hypothetical protein